jgi:hypothetical protein
VTLLIDSATIMPARQITAAFWIFTRFAGSLRKCDAMTHYQAIDFLNVHTDSVAGEDGSCFLGEPADEVEQEPAGHAGLIPRQNGIPACGY